MSKTRFVKVSSFYPEGIQQLYSNNPELKSEPYVKQHKSMMSQGIGWADFWIRNLNKSEKFEAEIFIINNEFAQRKWAEEAGITYEDSEWMTQILIEQIRHAKPEILFANDYVFLNNKIIKEIRETVPSIKLVLGWDGIGLCDVERFVECDVMISCGQQFVDFYESKGKRAVLFQFGFEKTLLNELNTERKLYDVSFAGSLTLRSGGHHQRLKMLGKVARNFNVDFWLSSFDNSKPYLIKNILRKIRDAEFSDATDIIKLWSVNKGNVYGLEMYQVLADSVMTLNSHIDTATMGAGNIRLWEATGVGACLITDWKPNLKDIFIPDEEVVTYASPEECVEKIKYLRSHPEKCKAIAAAGQKRTLTEYSYKKRINDFIPVLEKLL